MAKKNLKHKHQKLLNKLAKAKAQQNVSVLLREAIQALRVGNSNMVFRLASDAMSITDNPAESDAARQILAEAHFRAAVNGGFNTRAESLKEALKLTPDASHLHFCLAITLWQTGDLEKAVAEFDIVAAKEPNRRGLAYLHQLARLAQGRKLEISGLNSAEESTLRAVEALLSSRERGDVLSLPDGPMLGNLQQAWRAVADMRSDPNAAPAAVLQEMSDKGGYKKTISRILDYYRGVAAMRAGNKEAARAAWIKAQTAGFAQPWSLDNLACLPRERIIDLARQGKWQETANLINGLPGNMKDPVLKELAGLAYSHLGYQAAQAGKWEIAARHWRKAAGESNSCRLSQNLALAEEALENWGEAAEAWREMARRRSHKAGNSDYLENNQVAAVWRRAAECYSKDDDAEDEIVCLKTALKYVENNAELRLEIVDALAKNDQDKAAQNELKRILASDPNNIEALVRLGVLDSSNIDESMDIWRRALAVDPERFEAKDGLAKAYVEKLETATEWPKRLRIDFVEKGLKELPENPQLLLALARIRRKAGDDEEAVRAFLRVYRAAPNELRIVSHVLHESLHLKTGDAVVEEILPQMRNISGLLPAFWIDQGGRVLACEIGAERAMQFFDEAIALGERSKNKARTLIDVFMELNTTEIKEKDKEALEQYYMQRIRDEASESGALEYAQGYRIFHDKDDVKEARLLLKEARRKAQRAGEQAVIEAVDLADKSIGGKRGARIDDIDDLMDGAPFDLLVRLMKKFPNGPPDAKDLKKLSKRDLRDLGDIFGSLSDEFFEDQDY